METDAESCTPASLAPALRDAPKCPSGAGVQTFATAGLGLACQELMGEFGLAQAAPLLMAWTAPSALIVSRTDARLPGFDRAAERLCDEGWPVFVRRSGGSACPVSRGTIQIALARRVTAGAGIDAHYRDLTDLIERLLAEFGLVAEIGERSDAFCPGRYDMGVGLCKFAGLSQHWRPRGGAMIATTAATLVVDENAEELSRVVNLFYERAGGQRRCSSSAVTDMHRAMPSGLFPDGVLMTELCERLSGLIEGAFHDTLSFAVE